MFGDSNRYVKQVARLYNLSAWIQQRDVFDVDSGPASGGFVCGGSARNGKGRVCLQQPVVYGVIESEQQAIKRLIPREVVQPQGAHRQSSSRYVVKCHWRQVKNEPQ